MACHAARRLTEMNTNLAHIIAIELLISTQGIEFRAPVATSKHLTQVMRKVRAVVTPLEGDRYLADDLAAIKQLVADRSIIAALGETDLLPRLKP
jgi:histidine ammonia-lyase